MTVTFPDEAFAVTYTQAKHIFCWKTMDSWCEEETSIPSFESSPAFERY